MQRLRVLYLSLLSIQVHVEVIRGYARLLAHGVLVVGHRRLGVCAHWSDGLFLAVDTGAVVRAVLHYNVLLHLLKLLFWLQRVPQEVSQQLVVWSLFELELKDDLAEVLDRACVITAELGN